MADPSAYHGIHPAPVRSGCERVDWSPCVPRTDRVRVRAHTCECLPTVYEMCAAGGLMFIRRIDRKHGQPEIHESTWTRARDVEELWRRLITGETH
ncbi:hypothetical protein [Nonomuraea helvata]|uniref:Uncharacterized protein n=1 Tax=Nonomuraea helvata TaxID=37484 RepID=A0ABV5S5A6_9ACTN